MCRVGVLSCVRTASACAMHTLCFMTKQEEHISDKKELCVMGKFVWRPRGLGKCGTLSRGERLE
jgi:hypothetical protein